MLTSPSLRSLLERGQKLSERLEQTWREIDWTRTTAARLAVVGLDVPKDAGLTGGSVLFGLFEEDERLRLRMRRSLVEVGVLPFRVSDPAPRAHVHIPIGKRLPSCQLRSLKSRQPTRPRREWQRDGVHRPLLGASVARGNAHRGDFAPRVYRLPVDLQTEPAVHV